MTEDGNADTPHRAKAKPSRLSDSIYHIEKGGSWGGYNNGAGGRGALALTRDSITRKECIMTEKQKPAEGTITEQERALLQWILRMGTILEEILSNKDEMGEEAEPEEGSSDNDD